MSFHLTWHHRTLGQFYATVSLMMTEVSKQLLSSERPSKVWKLSRAPNVYCISNQCQCLWRSTGIFCHWKVWSRKLLTRAKVNRQIPSQKLNGKGKNGEKFKCKTSGSWWLWGGQQANYHTRPPIQLSLIVRPHADCKNKQGSWIVVKFWESFSLDCLFCKNIFENFAFFLFPQLRVLYPNILQNPPSIPDWGFPLSPLVGDCGGKLFWPFHTWYFHT